MLLYHSVINEPINLTLDSRAYRIRPYIMSFPEMLAGINVMVFNP